MDWMEWMDDTPYTIMTTRATAVLIKMTFSGYTFSYIGHSIRTNSFYLKETFEEHVTSKRMN